MRARSLFREALDDVATATISTGDPREGSHKRFFDGDDPSVGVIEWSGLRVARGVLR
jgi:hypothetical protein